MAGVEVDALVVAAGVVEAVLVAGGVAEVEPVVAPEPALWLLAPRWSSVLSVAGVGGGTEPWLGTLSATVVPPHAASATPLRVAASSATARLRGAFTAGGEAYAARTSGSR